MRDWNLGLNYIMLVPPAFVAFQLMKRYNQLLLWVEMLGFLILAFSIVFQYMFGMQNALFLIIGAHLAGLVVLDNDKNSTYQSKKLWVRRKIPFLTLMVGISVTKNLSNEFIWASLVILSFGHVVHGFIIQKLRDQRAMTLFLMPVMIILLYVIDRMLDDLYWVHTSTALVVIVWFVRSFCLAKELRNEQK